MDGSNQAMQPPANPPQTPVAAQPQPAVPQVPVSEPPSGDSKKMILWLVIGLVIVIVVVGGIYFFLNQQQVKNNAQQATGQETVQATPPDTTDALEKDLSTLNIEDAESDFTSIDQDLGQL